MNLDDGEEILEISRFAAEPLTAQSSVEFRIHGFRNPIDSNPIVSMHHTS